MSRLGHSLAGPGGNPHSGLASSARRIMRGKARRPEAWDDKLTALLMLRCLLELETVAAASRTTVRPQAGQELSVQEPAQLRVADRDRDSRRMPR